MTKVIEVGCAIIRGNRGDGKEQHILIAQRHPGAFLGGYWEFPGGKIEAHETVEECLVREIQEELGVQIRPVQLFCIQDHAYPGKTVRLHFYFCDWISGAPVRRDCHDFRWVRPEEMKNFNFIPADTEIINELIRERKRYF